jgi:hypothetical protein
MFANTEKVEARLRSTVSVRTIDQISRELRNKMPRGYNACQALSHTDVMSEIVELHLLGLQVPDCADVKQITEAKKNAIIEVYRNASSPKLQSFVSLREKDSAKTSNFFFEDGMMCRRVNNEGLTKYDVSWLNKAGFKVPILKIGETVICFHITPTTNCGQMSLQDYYDKYSDEFFSNCEEFNRAGRTFTYEHPMSTPIEITDLSIPIVNPRNTKDFSYWAQDSGRSDVEMDDAFDPFLDQPFSDVLDYVIELAKRVKEEEEGSYHAMDGEVKQKPQRARFEKNDKTKKQKTAKVWQQKKAEHEQPTKPQERNACEDKKIKEREAELSKRDAHYLERKRIITKSQFYDRAPFNINGQDFSYENEVCAWRFFSLRMQNTKFKSLQLKNLCIPIFRISYYGTDLYKLLSYQIPDTPMSSIAFGNLIERQLSLTLGSQYSEISLAVAKMFKQLTTYFSYMYTRVNSGQSMPTQMSIQSIGPLSTKQELVEALTQVDAYFGLE